MPRPTKWETHIRPYLDEIAAIKKQGKTDKQIAEYLGIGVNTLIDNKKKHVELSEALKKGKNELVLQLESALYKRALGGYYTKKITRVYIEDASGKKTGDVQVTETFTEERPDVGALVFALKNLDPDRWRDKVETNVNVEELSQAMHDFLDGKA